MVLACTEVLQFLTARRTTEEPAADCDSANTDGYVILFRQALKTNILKAFISEIVLNSSQLINEFDVMNMITLLALDLSQC